MAFLGLSFHLVQYLEDADDQRLRHLLAELRADVKSEADVSVSMFTVKRVRCIGGDWLPNRTKPV